MILFNLITHEHKDVNSWTSTRKLTKLTLNAEGGGTFISRVGISSVLVGWLITGFTVPLSKTSLLVLVEPFSSLSAQFAFCNQLVEQFNLGKQGVVGLLCTPAYKYHKEQSQKSAHNIRLLPAFSNQFNSPSMMNLVVSSPT